MMKKTILTLCSLGLLAACNTTPKNNITGKLEGVESQKLLVKAYPVADREAVTTDTIAMHDGAFAFRLDDSRLSSVHLYALPSDEVAEDGSRAAQSMQSVDFLLLPSSEVSISGTMDEAQVEGGAFYERYNSFKAEHRATSEQIKRIQAECSAMAQAGIARDSIIKHYAQIRPLSKQLSDAKFEYIKANPNDALSVVFLTQISRAQTEEAFGLLTEEVKNGEMADLYASLKRQIEQRQLTMENAKKVVEGCEAPDFSLNKPNGEVFTLSSLKGRYVVLDFWGSWCGWCIKGMPEMKKHYEQYHEKVEFVGIACRDSHEKWIEAIAEHQIPWINVRNVDQNDVAVMYGVNGYPTKFILDGEGRIVKKVIGEDPEFYKELQRLMK